jgi:hypothetical protein
MNQASDETLHQSQKREHVIDLAGSTENHL